jgi:hypothetical protein
MQGFELVAPRKAGAQTNNRPWCGDQALFVVSQSRFSTRTRDSNRIAWPPLYLGAVHSSERFSGLPRSAFWSEWRPESGAAVRADARGLTKSEIVRESLNGAGRTGILASNGGAVPGGDCCLYPSGGSCQYLPEQVKNNFAVRRPFADVVL